MSHADARPAIERLLIVADAAVADVGELPRSVRAVIDAAAELSAEPLAIAAGGSVSKTIVEIADRNDAATIVMGSRGLTGLRALLLGSVSSAVVDHADRPTLIVRRPLAPA